MKAYWVGIAATTAALMFSGQASADAEAGKAFFNKSMCKGCHGVDYEGFGPALRDVGAKYAGDAGAKDNLINKVKNGSTGVWGGNAMPPQKGQSDADIANVVDYILSLK